MKIKTSEILLVPVLELALLFFVLAAGLGGFFFVLDDLKLSFLERCLVLLDCFLTFGFCLFCAGYVIWRGLRWHIFVMVAVAVLAYWTNHQLLHSYGTLSHW